MTPRLRGFLIVGTICFVIGWAVTRLIVSTLQPGPDTRVDPGAKAGTAVAYDTYAFVLADDYDRPQPRVEGVWLAYVPADFSTIELVGLPPAPFEEQFSRALNGVPLLTLQPHLRGRLIGTITLDREDVAELVERIGGVYVLGQKMNGPELLAYVDLSESTRSTDLLLRQAVAVQSLLAEMAARGSQLDLNGLLQTPSACSIDQNKLYELVQRYYPVRTDLIRVLPQMEAAP